MDNNHDNMTKLKQALREDTMPLLTDDELTFLLENSDDINEAIYKGAIMKSENTTLSVSGLSTGDMSKYFLRLASMYRPNNSGTLKG